MEIAHSLPYSTCKQGIAERIQAEPKTVDAGLGTTVYDVAAVAAIALS